MVQVRRVQGHSAGRRGGLAVALGRTCRELGQPGRVASWAWAAAGRESGEGVKRDGGRENRGREGEQGGGGGWDFPGARARLGARVWDSWALVGRFSVGFVFFLFFSNSERHF
jgi:hypothetical protein